MQKTHWDKNESNPAVIGSKTKSFKDNSKIWYDNIYALNKNFLSEAYKAVKITILESIINIRLKTQNIDLKFPKFWIEIASYREQKVWIYCKSQNILDSKSLCDSCSRNSFFI